MKTQKTAELAFVMALLICTGSLHAQTWNSSTTPSNSWNSIACSADGLTLAAVSASDTAIYVSTNGGNTWNSNNLQVNPWGAIACSADGTKLVAAGHMGYIETSTNSGTSWMRSDAPYLNWYAVAGSADGVKLIATGAYGPPGYIDTPVVYTSTNSGINWMSNSAPASLIPWPETASSADGTKLAVASQLGQICTSTNGGLTWENLTNIPPADWNSLALSADGSKLVVVSSLIAPAFGGSVYISTNFGKTWSRSNAPDSVDWWGVAISANGTKLALTGMYSDASISTFFVSDDGGATWINGPASNFSLLSVTMSADGHRLAAIQGNVFQSGVGRIYTTSTHPQPTLSIAANSDYVGLSWLIPSTNFILEQARDLVGANWTIVTNPPALNLTNLQNEVWLKAPANSAYYRLVAP